MKDLKKKMMFLVVFLITSTILTGCWNNKDLTEISVATAFGLDINEDGKIEFTVQAARPTAMQKEGGVGEKSFWVFTSTGDTVFEAIRNQLSTIDRKINGSHLQFVVIGEKFAKKEVLNLIDILERDQEVNPQANVIITKGFTAKEALQIEGELKGISGMRLVDVVENYVAVAKMRKTTLFDLFKEMGSSGREPLVGVIAIKDQEKKEDFTIKDLKLEGSSVFKEDKCVGWLNSVETRGYLFTTNKVKSAVLIVPNPLHEGKKVGIEVIQSNAKMDVQLSDGKLTLIVEINQEGNIGDQQGEGDLTKTEIRQQLEEATEKVIGKEIRDAIKRAQIEYQADIFGFGEIVNQKYYYYWEQVEEHWNEEFSQAAVEIKVKSYIRRSGLIKGPTEPE